MIRHRIGGLPIDADPAYIGSSGIAIPDFSAVGEVAGGVHCINRLGCNQRLDHVVLGRVARQAAAHCMLGKDVMAAEPSQP